MDCFPKRSWIPVRTEKTKKTTTSCFVQALASDPHLCAAMMDPNLKLKFSDAMQRHSPEHAFAKLMNDPEMASIMERLY